MPFQAHHSSQQCRCLLLSSCLHLFSKFKPWHPLFLYLTAAHKLNKHSLPLSPPKQKSKPLPPITLPITTSHLPCQNHPLAPFTHSFNHLTQSSIASPANSQLTCKTRNHLQIPQYQSPSTRAQPLLCVLNPHCLEPSQHQTHDLNIITVAAMNSRPPAHHTHPTHTTSTVHHCAHAQSSSSSAHHPSPTIQNHPSQVCACLQSCPAVPSACPARAHLQAIAASSRCRTRTTKSSNAIAQSLCPAKQHRRPVLVPNQATSSVPLCSTCPARTQPLPCPQSTG